jgi:hypothetical protein
MIKRVLLIVLCVGSVLGAAVVGLIFWALGNYDEGGSASDPPHE